MTSSQTNTQTKTLQLLSCGTLTDKTYGVGHFIVENALEFSNWQAPIHIARSADKMRKPLPDNKMSLAQRAEARKGIQKARRQSPFHVEDSSKKNVFNGYLELDQSNKFDSNSTHKYVVLKAQEGTFRVLPIDDWYTFKREPKNPTLSLEEAEKMMKEMAKNVKSSSDTTKRTNVTTILKVKEEKEVTPPKPAVEGFNPTGEVDIDEDDIGVSKRIKKDKGEDMDYNNEFDDDNKEDKYSSTFEEVKLSSNSIEMKKLMREKTGETLEDDFSDDEDKEFVGVEELLEKKIKETKAEKRGPSDSLTGPATKKQRTDTGASTGEANTGVTEKDMEKLIRDYLSINGKVTLSKLIQKLKGPITSIGKDAFKLLLKRITEARKEDGQTYIFLKDDQYRDFR